MSRPLGRSRTAIEDALSPPVVGVTVYKTPCPFGSISGHQCPDSPRVRSGRVSTVGVPPSALTRSRIEDDLVDGHGRGFPKMLTRGGIRRMAKTKRIFTETDRQKLLSAIEQCRKAGIDALGAPCTGNINARTSALIDAIDNVAELLTSNRDHFWLEPTTNAHFK